MNFKQCPGCDATVESSKAYCPDCGSPMDEEQKRTESSEYDLLVKTQQITNTTQSQLPEFKFSEYFNQSPGSPSKAKKTHQSNEIEGEKKSVLINLQPVAPDTAPHDKPKNISIKSDIKLNQAISKDASGEKNAAPDKKLHLVIGAILVFLLLVTIGLIIFGISS